MKKYRLENYTKGWIIGDFQPSIFRTKDFEITIKTYQKGDYENKHVHKIADEYTVIVSGVYKMSGELLNKRDIVQVHPNEVVDFECLEDGNTVVIKVPSIKGDKYVIDK